jgi:hypothetical protein
MCVDRHKWRVLPSPCRLICFPFRVREVFPSTLLPGFSGLASSVLHMDLPPSAPSALQLSRALFASVFYPVSRPSAGRAGGFPWVRLYDLPTYRPPPHRFASPDIGPRLFASARPAPRSHIGGSLFVTYVGSTSCFLSTRRFCARSCLVGVALPSGNGGQFYFRRTAPEDQS